MAAPAAVGVVVAVGALKVRIRVGFEVACGAEDRAVVEAEGLGQGVLLDERELCVAAPELGSDGTDRSQLGQVAVELLPGGERGGAGSTQKLLGGGLDRDEVACLRDRLGGLVELWSQAVEEFVGGAGLQRLVEGADEEPLGALA